MDEPSKSAEALYQALMRHFVHEDRLIYQSLPYLSAIQTATLGGSWIIARTHPPIAAGLAFLGALLTMFYLNYVTAIRRDRDINEEILYVLGAELIKHTRAANHRPRLDAYPDGRFCKLHVITTMKAVIILFFTIDCVLCAAFLIGWLP